MAHTDVISHVIYLLARLQVTATLQQVEAQVPNVEYDVLDDSVAVPLLETAPLSSQAKCSSPINCRKSHVQFIQDSMCTELSPVITAISISGVQTLNNSNKIKKNKTSCRRFSVY
jgi:hypothetical protein